MKCQYNTILCYIKLCMSPNSTNFAPQKYYKYRNYANIMRKFCTFLGFCNNINIKL